MGPTGQSRVLQIHPTLRCNLRCHHCYSSSSPDAWESLDSSLLCEAISDAANEGYNIVSLSGGEPLLYQPLPTLLERAKAYGLRTTLTTNGMLLGKSHLQRLKGVTDLIAFSLDGLPESHNHNRGSAQAFEKMSSRLEDVRASGIPFGFIFTLTQYNLPELEWVAQFALEQGAKLLQIHPLEGAGRAAEKLMDNIPDALEVSFSYLEAARIQRMVGSQLFVQVDLVNREALRTNPGAFYADSLCQDKLPRLASQVSPLVIETDGTVVPLQYGFARSYSLGNLREAPLRELYTRWQDRGLHSFRFLCQRAFESIVASAEMPFFNWYEIIAQMANQVEPQV